jgi:transglutaminase-like putative cysteine protease
MGSNIYDPANKILTLAIPDLQVGDIVGLRVRSVVKKARIPGFWGNYIPLQSNAPILKYEVKIDAPEKLPLRSIALKDKEGPEVKFKQEKKNGRIYYYWKAENVPQAIPEPDMPPLYTAVQRLLLGTAENWKEISQWYYKLCRPHLDKTDAAIRQKVAELTKNAKSRDEKIMVLFQFVSQQIRYMGLTPESEAPGYEPHDVTLTFHRRYGVCRDKAALLAAMLETAGLKEPKKKRVEESTASPRHTQKG